MELDEVEFGLPRGLRVLRRQVPQPRQSRTNRRLDLVNKAGLFRREVRLREQLRQAGDRRDRPPQFTSHISQRRGLLRGPGADSVFACLGIVHRNLAFGNCHWIDRARPALQ